MPRNPSLISNSCELLQLMCYSFFSDDKKILAYIICMFVKFSLISRAWLKIYEIQCSYLWHDNASTKDGLCFRQCFCFQNILFLSFIVFLFKIFLEDLLQELKQKYYLSSQSNSTTYNGPEFETCLEPHKIPYLWHKNRARSKP